MSLNISECSICYSSDGQLLNLCHCSGTVAHIHSDCLKQWVEISGENKCRICGHKWIGFEVIASEMDLWDYIKSDGFARDFIIDKLKTGILLVHCW